MNGSHLLLLAIIAFLLIYPRPWRRRKVEEDTPPDCYGDWPHFHPQDAAERDCHRCHHGHQCFETTPYHPRKR